MEILTELGDFYGITGTELSRDYIIKGVEGVPFLFFYGNAKGTNPITGTELAFFFSFVPFY